MGDRAEFNLIKMFSGNISTIVLGIVVSVIVVLIVGSISLMPSYDFCREKGYPLADYSEIEGKIICKDYFNNTEYSKVFEVEKTWANSLKEIDSDGGG